jgi:phosphate transport system substrate-binding protein
MIGKRTLAIVALTTLVSCSNQTVPATTPPTSVTPLRMYTTTATHPLALDLATAYNRIQPDQSFQTRFANYQMMLAELESDDAFYFFTNHLPADSELWAAPIGQDGLAIIANSKLENITLDELRAIYQGHLTDWHALNAIHNQSIIVFSREQGSATRAEFEQMVMGHRVTTSNARVVSSSDQIVELVSQTPGSIGYVSMGHIQDNNRVLRLNGILPNRQTVMDNTYPLRSTIFVVGQRAPTGPYRELIGWIQSPDGQEIIAQRHAPLFQAPANP